MYASPSPSPAPSPPAFLYLNSHAGSASHHHQQSGSHGGGILPGSGAGSQGGGLGAGGAGGQGSSNPLPFGTPNGSGFPPVGRYPGQSVGWPPRAHHHPHHHHQPNPSLSSLPGSITHSSAASASAGPPSSPGYGSLSNGPSNHAPHHHHHHAHGPHALSHMASPAALHSTQNHMSAASSSTANTSPHWQQQLLKAEVRRVSRLVLRLPVSVFWCMFWRLVRMLTLAHVLLPSSSCASVRSRASLLHLTTTLAQRHWQHGVRLAPPSPSPIRTRASRCLLPLPMGSS